MHLLTRLFREDQAQDLIEYALIAGFVCFVAALGVAKVGHGLNGTYQAMSAKVTQARGDDRGDGFRVGQTDGPTESRCGDPNVARDSSGACTSGTFR